MRRWDAVVITSFLLAACGGRGAASAADSTSATQHVDDSIIEFRMQLAPALADTARRTVAVLLKHPESAVFDSLIVVQPPKERGSWPTPLVCGRIGGKPGIGGRSAMTPFVYQNRVNVFLLDQGNGPAFAALRAKGCGNSAARVLLK